MDAHTRIRNALGGPAVPELLRLGLRPVLDHRGQPVLITGHDAVVARMIRSDGAYRALRVPLLPERARDWEVRYQALGKRGTADAGSVLPRAIEPIEGGISLGQVSWPAILMEWIDGPTLLQAADRAARGGNIAVLRALTDAVKDLAEALRRESLVHGNLAADNVLMRSTGDLVCVGLDKLSWPGSPPGMSDGHLAGSQRTKGRSRGPQEDAFALLVHYVALHVLADDPDLRRTYGDPVSAHGGCILFSERDLSEPALSRTFSDAWDRVGLTARGFIDQLRRACREEHREAEDILMEVMGLPHAGAAESMGTVAGSSTWDLSDVIERLKTTYADQQPTDRIAKAATRQPVPTPTSESIIESRIEDRQRLQDAIDRRNGADVIQWAARLADDPIAQLYKMDVEQVLADSYRERIIQAAERRRDDMILLLAEESASRRLPLDSAARRAVRSARERIEVRAKLDRALEEEDRLTLADLAVSGELVVLGDADRSSLQKVLQAIEWPSLERALETDEDLLILEAFDDELFGEEGSLPVAVRARVALARERLAWISDVRSALKARNPRELARLFAAEPEGASARLGATERARALRTLEQQAALDALQGAMRDGNDATILQALHVIERVGARIEDRFLWSALQGVMNRATVIESIVNAANARPVDDRQLAHLLPVARTMGLMHDPVLKGDLAWRRLQALVARGSAVRRIRRAIQTDDDRAIRAAAYPDLSGAIDDLTAAERERVEAARHRRNTT